MSVPSAVPAGPQSWVRGPTRSVRVAAGPTAAPTVEPAETTAPPSTHHDTGISWVGAHGGAGASTLASLLGGADVGRRWPDPTCGEPGRMVLLARTHAAGLQAAGRVLESLQKGQHPPGLELVAVALIADAPGRLPMSLSRRVRVLCSAVRTYRVPWVASWRLGGQPDRLPKEVRRVADLIGLHALHPEEA